MKTFDYPLEQFLSHFTALITVGRYREACLDYDIMRSPLYVGDSRELEAQLFRLMDYMAQVVEDKHEQLYKVAKLWYIKTYVTRHFSVFEQGGLAISGSGDEQPLISESVLQALHFIFTVPEPPNDVDPNTVIGLARSFEQQEG